MAVVEVLSLVFAVLLFVAAATGLVFTRKYWKGQRQIRQRTRHAEWTDMARTMSWRERTRVSLAALHGRHLPDPRLSALVSQRARHLLAMRHDPDYSQSIRWYHDSLIFIAIGDVLLGGVLITNWYVAGVFVSLIVGIILVVAFVPYAIVVIWFFPWFYSRTDRRVQNRLRRAIEVNGEG